MTPPSQPIKAPTTLLSPPVDPAEERVPIRGQLRTLFVWFIPLAFSTYLIWGAVPGVLLPLQVTAVDPANKVANLAIVTSIGAFVGMLSQPIAGTLSDRTRSTYGRRSPFILLGALFSGLSLVGLAVAPTITLIVIAYSGVQFFVNFSWGPANTALPDRVPVRARGKFSAAIGAATMVGSLGGGVVAAQFARIVPIGFITFGALLFLVALLFVIFTREDPSTDLPREPFRALPFLSNFWVNPIAHPAFFWAFLGRFLFNGGYVLVYGYQLFLLEDYIGLGADAVKQIPLLTIASLPTLLIGTLLSGPLSDRFGRRKIFVAIASVIMAAAIAVPAVMPTTAGMLIFTTTAGFGLGAFSAVDQALMTQVLPSASHYAKDIGVINIASALPQAIAPAVAGALVLTFGYVALFPVGIVLVLLGGLAVFFVKGVR